MTKNGHVKHGDWFFGTHEPWCVCGWAASALSFILRSRLQAKGQSQFEFLGLINFNGLVV